MGNRTSTAPTPTIFTEHIPRPRRHSNPRNQTLIELGEIGLGTLDIQTLSALHIQGLSLNHWNDGQYLMIVHLVDSLKNFRELRELSEDKLFAITYMILEGTQGSVIQERYRMPITMIRSIDGGTIIKPFRSNGMSLSEWLKECFNHLDQGCAELQIYWKGINLMVQAIAMYLENHEFPPQIYHGTTFIPTPLPSSPLIPNSQSLST